VPKEAAPQLHVQVDDDDDNNDSNNEIQEPVEAVVAQPSFRTLRRRRCVSFGIVHGQQYKVMLVDHRVCEGGYPLGLDWGHALFAAHSLDGCAATKKKKKKKKLNGPFEELRAEKRKRRTSRGSTRSSWSG
jgi:hypothetical protein